MQDVLESLGVPTVHVDVSGKIVWAASSLEEHLESDVPPIDAWEVGPAEFGRRAREIVLSAPSTFETWIPKAEGAVGFRAVCRPFDDGVLVTLVPIDDRMHHDGRPNRGPDVYMRLAPDTTILFCSAPCMGKPPSTVKGKRFVDLLPPEWSGSFARLCERVIQTREPSSGSDRVDYGSEVRTFFQRLSPIIVEDEVVELAFQNWDTTEETDTAAALKATEAQYRHVIENSLDLVGIIESKTGRIVFVSPNSSEILGHAPGEIVGRSILDIVAEQDRELARGRINSLIERKTSKELVELRICASDGTERQIEARGRLLETGEEAERIILNARDISDRRESQLLRRSLLRADKLAAIGQVAASVAHEVNNPASFITTNLHVMQEELDKIAEVLAKSRDIIDSTAPERASDLAGPDPDWEPRDAVDELQVMLATNLRGMERISHIVRELRGFSREDEEELEFVRIGDVVRASCAMVRNQISYFADLVEEVSADVPFVYGDRGKISQVLINLLVNASHSLQSAPRERQHEVRVAAYAFEGSVRIDVHDTGTGVPPSVRPQIFDPFFTTKKEDEGTGLGLWLCREIVEKLGGRLWLEHSDADGSCFSFILPAQTAAEMPDSPFEEISSSAELIAPGARILFIDDDSMVLDAYVSMLDDQLEAVRAHGGAEGRRLLDSGESFDVIICDIMMPGFDGIDLFSHVKRTRPELLERFFFCTAGVFTDRTRRFIAEQSDRVFHKPLSSRQLRGIIKGAVAGNEERRGPRKVRGA